MAGFPLAHDLTSLVFPQFPIKICGRWEPGSCLPKSGCELPCCLLTPDRPFLFFFFFLQRQPQHHLTNASLCACLAQTLSV